MTKKLFEKDELTGATKYWHYDADKDEAIIETVYDATPYIEQNKALYNAHDSTDRWGEWTRVAQVPMQLYWELKAKGIADDPKAMKKWLNDRDNLLFRTRPGKV
jgi:hypothetical protein